VKLQNKTAVVTGANQGLGLAIASAFVREGAHVLLCARNAALLEEARARLEGEAKPGQNVLALPADVASDADVAGLAALAETRWPSLDVLVCNAGIYGPKGAIEDVDWIEWLDAIRINLSGAVLCCRAFLPLLRKSRRGKIILVSGGGATKPLPFLSAYAASKAGLVRFAETLAEELRPRNIDVNSIAPGALNTRLLDEVLEAGPARVGEAFYQASLKQKASGGTPPEKGAELCVYLAGEQSDGITGKLISAVWDPWNDFQTHRKELESTDVYTLRRIIPSERGFPWG
jgi:NAD(P)-dependent dehydrogenase (short-subunit alcohol dehydrogenase family)